MLKTPRFAAAPAAIAALVCASVPLFCASAAHAQDPVIAPPGTPATPTTQTATTQDTTPAEPAPRKKFAFGPELGVYFPNSGKTRDAFGNVWFNYGFGFGTIQTASEKGSIQFDLNVLGGSRGGNRAYLAPIGASYRRALGKGISASPYIGVSANVVPTYLRASNYGVSSKVRFAAGGSAFIGYTFSERAYIQARYYGISQSAGFELSGLSVSTGFRF